LDAGTRQAIGTALGRFLRDFHACQVGGLRTRSIDDELSQYQQKYRLGRPALDALPAKELRAVQAFFFEDLPSEMRRLGGDVRLTHGDLAPWNIVLSDALEVGVIDFGDVAYQDPSKDFSGFGDELLLNAAFEAYAADRLLREKAWLRTRAFPMLDVPYYLGKGDTRSVQMCLELIRQRIVRGELWASNPLK
jgi:aminoglycoside phosphotransferase (APT) family kinase protein